MLSICYLSTPTPFKLVYFIYCPSNYTLLRSTYHPSKYSHQRPYIIQVSTHHIARTTCTDTHTERREDRMACIASSSYGVQSRLTAWHYRHDRVTDVLPCPCPILCLCQAKPCPAMSMICLCHAKKAKQATRDPIHQSINPSIVVSTDIHS